MASHTLNKLIQTDTRHIIVKKIPHFFLFHSETGAEPSLQATQMRLKRARLADNLNEKIAQRPGPMELVEKNILPVDSTLKQAIIGESHPVRQPVLFEHFCLNGLDHGEVFV